MAFGLKDILGLLGGGGIGGVAGLAGDALGGTAGKAVSGIGSALGGGGAGALGGTGGLAGAALGGVGKALGGEGGGLGSFFLGDPAREKQFQLQTPEQQAVLDQLLQQGSEGFGTDKIEALARKRFSEETIPSLAERFTAMGGGQRSSAFQSALGRAGSDLESQMGALGQQGALQQLMLGLQPRFSTLFSPPSQGALGGGASSLMSLLPLLRYL